MSVLETLALNHGAFPGPQDSEDTSGDQQYWEHLRHAETPKPRYEHEVYTHATIAGQSQDGSFNPSESDGSIGGKHKTHNNTTSNGPIQEDVEQFTRRQDNYPMQEFVTNGKTSDGVEGNMQEKRLRSPFQALINEAVEVEDETVLESSVGKVYELTSSPNAIPILQSSHSLVERAVTKTLQTPNQEANRDPEAVQRTEESEGDKKRAKINGSTPNLPSPSKHSKQTPQGPISSPDDRKLLHERPRQSSRTISTPTIPKKQSIDTPVTAIPLSAMKFKSSRPIPTPLDIDSKPTRKPSILAEDPPSPMPSSIPMPPFSLPAYLQLELSSNRPSPLYIYRSASSELPYESSRIKIERLLNFLLLPPLLEQTLWFGALACLDAWLYTFTILPLRFMKAIYILCLFWGRTAVAEVCWLADFIYTGLGRLWSRRKGTKSGSVSSSAPTSTDRVTSVQSPTLPDSQAQTGKPLPLSTSEDQSTSRVFLETAPKRFYSARLRQRRTKPAISTLMPNHKEDIIKGLLIIISCIILMNFDASMMYHSIRGQAAIKLYVIYNVLEVCDRLLSALGQDVLECLFSKESLERKPDGRSKIFRPFWLFILALIYNLVHSTALFYQVITLNVAVNSYSNALLTLLMSNQFVEIKSTVFKRFEKENLFQLTCADVVERFQLWLMLIIIASRNIIETNSLSGLSGPSTTTSMPIRGPSILPKSFTIFPDWTGQVMGPFLLVLGTEMLVDWLKHAYVTKFNNVKPNIYGRFLDVLAKDYYSNAFADQNLTRRLGLPTIPLSCLFIRASVQTYQMFLATALPSPLQPSSTPLPSASTPHASPSTTTSLTHIDTLFRYAFGHPAPSALASSPLSWSRLLSLTPLLIQLLTLLLTFLVLLALKLVLGMVLLSFARNRYRGMKAREHESSLAEGKRVGGWGVVEVGEEKRRWIYVDDEGALRKLREREERGREREKEGGEKAFEGVKRYSMVGKRIW